MMPKNCIKAYKMTIDTPEVNCQVKAVDWESMLQATSLGGIVDVSRSDMLEMDIEQLTKRIQNLEGK